VVKGVSKAKIYKNPKGGITSLNIMIFNDIIKDGKFGGQGSKYIKKETYRVTWSSYSPSVR